MTFLEIIGAAFLVLIVKFLWDEHIKLTPKVGQSPPSLKPDLQKENAMKAYLMPEISLGILAGKLNCQPENAAMVFKKGIHEEMFCSGLSSNVIDERIKSLLEATPMNKQREAKEASQSFGYVVKPEDTASGMMYKWIKEVVDATVPTEAKPVSKNLYEKINVIDGQGPFIYSMTSDDLRDILTDDQLRQAGFTPKLDHNDQVIMPTIAEKARQEAVRSEYYARYGNDENGKFRGYYVIIHSSDKPKKNVDFRIGPTLLNDKPF